MMMILWCTVARVIGVFGDAGHVLIVLISDYYSVQVLHLDHCHWKCRSLCFLLLAILLSITTLKQQVR